MDVATTREVGIRELKNNLSRYIERVAGGEEVLVTDRGRPVARLVGVDRATEHLAELVAAGIVRPPTGPRNRPATLVEAGGSVSDLVADQRR